MEFFYFRQIPEELFNLGQRVRIWKMLLMQLNDRLDLLFPVFQVYFDKNFTI
jgi:hypothetical protein